MPNTILCANGCHVYSVGSLRCHCGAAANGYPPTSATIFQGYHPVGYSPPKPDPVPETSLSQLRAAMRAGASWLSADGKFAYCERYGAVLKAEWDGDNFGVWWPVEGEMPAEAVKL